MTERRLSRWNSVVDDVLCHHFMFRGVLLLCRTFATAAVPHHSPQVPSSSRRKLLPMLVVGVNTIHFMGAPA